MSAVSFAIILPSSFIDESFKASQQKNTRVKTAYTDKEKTVADLLKAKNINILSVNIFIRVFKQDGILELWAKNKSDVSYQLLNAYPICAMSGTIGPKRKMGDMQTPEGFYHIDRFNPASNFFLSLGINYPNSSDKIFSKGHNPGGDIFIHGNCVSIGCMAITDDLIKEVYILAVEAKNNGQQKIPVHIFPFKLTDDNIAKQKKGVEQSTIDLWNNLKAGFNFFEEKKTLPKIAVSTTGKYIFS
jgi:murein L,D-transpeptidase YafK